MRFRLFGVNVEIQMFFWITAVMLGSDYLNESYLRWIDNQGALHVELLPKTAIVVWVAVVLVSILVHEFGHAFAVKRHHIEPAISLYWMGGVTTYRPVLPLSRLDDIMISLAGPFAGFSLAAVVYGAERAAPGFIASLPLLGRLAVIDLMHVNLFWGLINLLPVLPFDGGLVMRSVLGPRRERIAVMVSMVAGGGIALFFLVYYHSVWGAFLFGMGAARSYQRLAACPAIAPVRAVARSSAPGGEPLPAELAVLLQTARAALADEDLKRARELAEKVVEQSSTPRATLQALEVITWVHLLDGRPEEAAQTLAQARRFAEPDAALSGAVFFARGDTKEARRILEAARARGDGRKEVVGLLIRILLEAGETARAAAVAFDIVDSLSDEDARKMAAVAYEGAVYEWSGRLYEAMFARRALAEDAYEAARAFAKAGQPDQALELLRKAVDAGFSDRARAWSDAALEALRTLPPFESFLPRP
jgi:Zn-dependent protease